ncbi:hypothetical protein [Quadrisphaera sp. KR29]|uniref:hypothetical protein n=1 Tax=Quadrisphaera sp. KR29 TaxID=3461391 RepID=UPI0040440C36
MVITAEDLDAARQRTAGEDSDLSAAVAAVAGAGAATLSPSATQVVAGAQVAAAATTHPLTIAVVGYKGTTDASYTDAAVRANVASASSYWSGQTAGAIDFSTASITRYNSTIACSPYSYSSAWNEARTQTGFTPGANKHLVIIYPQAAYNDGCSYGLGTVGSSVGGGGSVYVTDLSWSVLAHELGHNMSLQHSNYLACLPDVIQTSTDQMPAGYTNGYASGCGEQEYGDGLDVMSSSAMNKAAGASSVALRRLGVLSTSDGTAADLSSAGVSTYTVTLWAPTPGCARSRSPTPAATTPTTSRPAPTTVATPPGTWATARTSPAARTPCSTACEC